MRKRSSGIRKWDSSAARAALLIERLEDRVLLDALGWEPGTGQLAALPATFVQNAGQVDDPAT